MNRVFDRMKKTKPYKLVLALMLVTFLIVFSNSVVFHLMEHNHECSRVFITNFVVSLGLTGLIFLLFNFYFKYLEKKPDNSVYFDETVLNLVLDNLDTCIYMTEVETGKIIFINKKMRNEFGGGDFIGKTCWKVLQENFKERCSFCPIYKLKEDSSKPYIWEEHNTVTKKYYENTDTLIKWIDGSLVHMQHSVNITDRKMQEMEIIETLNKLELVMLNYPGVIISFDEDRRSSFASGSNVERFETLRKYLSGENSNNPLYNFEEYKDKMDLAYKGACSHWVLDIEDESYNCFLSPIINNYDEIIGALFAANDMSESVKMQKELKKAINLAEQASKAKSEFLSRMSHEMRTPLNAILGMTRIGSDSASMEKMRYCLKTIDGSSKHLLGLINDVLDMAKIEANKFVLDHSSFNMEKMMMNVCNIILEKVQEKKQTLNILLGQNIHQLFVGDEMRLSQVLTNLLANAVKFTPVEGKITLSVEEVETTDKDSVVRFVISDTGIGMTAEQQAKLFGSFEQADAAIGRKYGGTGLGLAISKSIVEKMEGKIWVESELDKGSKFSFEVRLDISSESTAKMLAGSIRPSDLRVLVVDDSEEILEYFTQIMGKFGVKTDTAKSGVEAIDLVNRAIDEHRKYDVIFLDWHIPEMDGIEIAKRINPKIDNNTAIIMISISEWSELEEHARSVGINRYIPKPLFPSSILNAINEVVGHTMQKLDIKSSHKKEKPNFAGANILLVDDVAINREILIAFLEGTNINIESAENGRQAVDKFKKEPDKYDLIVMDIHMPEMDGYEATRAIRALGTEKSTNIPIVAMTANAFKEDVEKCLENGMNDHLAKPIDKEQVIQKLTIYLSKSAPQEEHLADYCENKEIEKVHVEETPVAAPVVETVVVEAAVSAAATAASGIESFLPYIDVKEMEHRLSDNMDIYPELLNIFLQNEMIEELKQEFANGNRDAAKGLAHALKGIMGNLSLSEAYKKAVEVDSKFKAGTEQQKDIDEFEKTISTTKEYIHKLIEFYENNPSIKC